MNYYNYGAMFAIEIGQTGPLGLANLRIVPGLCRMAAKINSAVSHWIHIGPPPFIHSFIQSVVRWVALPNPEHRHCEHSRQSVSRPR